MVGLRSPECAYCGAAGATTRDHVPPRSIFGKPTPENLPTVPSCATCNNGASNDDEYFRDVVAMHHRVSKHPEARSAVEAMVRAAGKPNKRGYAEATVRRFTTVDAITAAGIHLGAVPAFRVDTERMQRAVSRYVKGLYWYEHKLRLPPEFEVIVRANPEGIASLQPEIEQVLRNGKHRVVKDRVFWYAWVSPVDNPNASLWLIVLFNEFAILALVRPVSRPTE